MKCVILSAKPLPMYNGIHGPILSPAEYDVYLILKFLAAGIDVREVMDDGSYRKLDCNDEKLLELLDEKNKNNMEKLKERRNRTRVVENIPQGNVRLKEERNNNLPVNKPKKEKNKEDFKKQKPKEEVKHEVKKEEPKVDLIIDELEKPE
jgi:hypothetical protein